MALFHPANLGSPKMFLPFLPGPPAVSPARRQGGRSLAPRESGRQGPGGRGGLGPGRIRRGLPQWSQTRTSAAEGPGGR
jgi:hypothetical protein